MSLRLFSLLCGLSLATFALADNNNTLPVLQGGYNVDKAKMCIQNTQNECGLLQLNSWEQKDACTRQRMAINPNCPQTLAIYQKLGILPDKIQAIGPVTVFTLMHIADGMGSFHMVDSTGTLIDLVDDQNPIIANNPEFKKLQQAHPGAGLTQQIAGKVSEAPQVVEPKELANKKGDDVLQLIFPQYVKQPPCVACQVIAVADISYRFSPEGKFLNVAWIKADKSPISPDTVDKG